MKRVLAVLLVLIIPPAIYFPTLSAKHDEEQERADATLKNLEMRVEMARAAQRKLTQFHEELTRLDVELLKLRQILPAQMAIGEVRALIEVRATGDGVRLTKFEAGATKALPPVQQQSIGVEVIGSVDGTARFFRDLENAARVIDVSSVTLRKDPAGWRTDFILTCYAMPDAH